MGLKTYAKLTSWITLLENGRQPSYMKVHEIFIKLKAKGNKDIDFYSQSWNLMSVKINVKMSPLPHTEKAKVIKEWQINQTGCGMHIYTYLYMFTYMHIYIHIYMFTYCIIYVVSDVKVSFDEMVCGPRSDALWPPGHFRTPWVHGKSDYFPSVRKGALGVALGAGTHAGKRKRTQKLTWSFLIRNCKQSGQHTSRVCLLCFQSSCSGPEFHNILLTQQWENLWGDL